MLLNILRFYFLFFSKCSSNFIKQIDKIDKILLMCICSSLFAFLSEQACCQQDTVSHVFILVLFKYYCYLDQMETMIKEW